jgi:hypothetical protein
MNDKEMRLYRYEYTMPVDVYDGDDDIEVELEEEENIEDFLFPEEKSDIETFVDWVYAKDEFEVLDHGSVYENKISFNIRLATIDEASAYEDGFIEGRMLAQASERMMNWDGVGYRLDSFNPMITVKTFICGICDGSYDFTNAAMHKDFFLMMEKDNGTAETNWHICKGCS